MKIFLTILFTIIVFILIGLVVMYSGMVNVSVLERPSGLTEWILSTTMEHSVKSRANDVVVPDLTDEQMIRTGAEHYMRMCQGCHGAPGRDDIAMVKGLEPKPPHLYTKEEADEWNAAEQFWVTKHGIMMTAMPAWGVTHSDEKIWNIVAFLRTLPEMSADEYKQLSQDIMTASESGEGHGHEEGEEHEHKN